LLEAVYLLATGESFRAKLIDEMINFGQEVGRLTAEVADEDGDANNLEVVLTRGFISGKKTAKRRFLLNNAAKRRSDFSGKLLAVIFRPEDMKLISGTPFQRRVFLDMVLSQTDKEYQRSLAAYEQALKRRNKLLDAIREGLTSRYTLTFWNGLLIKHGQEIFKKRQELLTFINELWGRSEMFVKLTTVYDSSTISEGRLEQYKEEEVAVGYTLVGPHKDDFQVVNMDDGKGRNLATFGSRGEQRMAVLALKMGEIYFIEEKRSEKPVLLLDDIFSELDAAHRQEVLRVMQNRQVIVTTAEKEEAERFGKTKIFRLS
ncbi:DNA replication/repair protein RecF, partial [Candidatus Collierbacteria bacterium]|nr:DNA replication/repair protein RecF [Candidatus Collierbacteria bacterium]